MAISNLFNPKWKHSDPAVRISAVKQSADSDLIALIAREDTDKDVRLAAIKQLDDISSLEKALENERDEYNINYIKKSLNKLYSDKVLSSSNLSDSELYVGKITEEEVLCKLVSSVDDYDTASLICSKISTESLLAKIAKNSKNKKLCCDLIYRITDISLLEILSKSAVLSSVKKEASKKIFTFKGEPEERQKEISRKAEYESLCQRTERVCDSTDWDECDNKFAELKDEWKFLGKIPEKDYKVFEKRFESACDRYVNKKQLWKRAEELKHAKLSILEDLCGQIQEFINADDFQKKKESVYKLKKRWKREIEHVSFAEELAARFSLLTSEYDDKYKVLKEDQAKRLVLEKETLSAFITEIEGFINAENCQQNVARVKEIQARWEGTHTDSNNDDDLNATFKKVIKTFFKKLKLNKEARDWERWEHYALKLELCEKASALLEKRGDMHVVAKSLKELRGEWKAIGEVPKSKAQELWLKFDSICENIHKKCLAFYADLDERNKKNLALKIALCERAEALQDKENTRENADTIKKLQKEWKDIGFIPRHTERTTFDRFQKACNTFFERRKKEYERVKVIYDKNKKAKEALCEEAEKIIDMDFRLAKSFEHDLKLKWKKIGHVAREDSNPLRNKFNEPFEKFRENMLLQAPENLSKKEEICSQLEALLDSITEGSDYKELKPRVKEIERSWSSIGPAPEDKEKQINSKYSSAIEDFYKKEELFYQEKDKLQNENLTKKKELINTLESVFEVDEEESALEGKVRNAQTQWETIGEIPAEKEDEIERQYKGLCDSFFNGDKNFFNSMQKEKEENLKLKIELCVKAEKLANLTTEDSAMELDLSSLVDELSFAIGSNFIAEKQTNPKDEMRKLIENWRQIGDVQPSEEAKITQRFKSACDSFK